MNLNEKNRFVSLWKKYFNQSELPVTAFYHQKKNNQEIVKPGTTGRCFVDALGLVRDGQSLTLDVNSIDCFGGRKYLGFTQGISPNFEYFLSCGIPGKMEGERYKRSPELVLETSRSWPVFKAPAPYITLKRWDQLDEQDEPELVIFFAGADVLSALFTLFNFDEAGPEGVFTPMSSGCSSIITYPYLERLSPHPRGVIGMFDPSARPFVPRNMLTFALPMARFIQMAASIEESFLITRAWKEIQQRID
ncbi:MAG TPA: DUF169 domain-containing protein [Dehalococcoidales bacterium]|nr:DUF169 domain-containing protein [Dehalococcoidales bacterium]